MESDAKQTSSQQTSRIVEGGLPDLPKEGNSLNEQHIDTRDPSQFNAEGDCNDEKTAEEFTSKTVDGVTFSDPSGDHLAVSLEHLTVKDVGEETSGTTQVNEKSTIKSDRSSNSETKTVDKQVYRLKWIEWHNKRTAIVTQNENGPCPLIAIANVLLLKFQIKLRASMEYITAEELIDFIGDAIMESIPKDLQGANMLNYEQNMHDAIAILPRLHTGLDVNVKFTGVQDFEYTPECIIFDLLDIPLYHGWVVDPQCHEVVTALGNVGYNQLVEKIILNKCSSDPDEVTEALIAEQFLERTASQLTYHGLWELNSAMKRGELAVLFRNNHFSTILKKKVSLDRGEHAAIVPVQEELHELFQLVTDQGFLHEQRVVWETLSNIEGDGQFVDCHFATVPPKAADFIPTHTLTEEQQINQDYLVALSLQEEQRKEDERDHTWQEYGDSGASDLVDAQLARQLQEQQLPTEEPAIPGRAPSPSVSTSGRLLSTPSGERAKKGAMCTVI